MKTEGYGYLFWMISVITAVVLAKTDKGKSEAFSSTANLVQLVMSEKAIALKLENMLKEDEKKLAEAKRYF